MTIVTIEKVDDEGIYCDNGYFIYSRHDPDCCEYHWLAFEEADDDLVGKQLNLSEEWFIRVEDYGIRLVPINEHEVCIPGYGQNNGYYSSNISLYIIDSNGFVIQEHDVSECQDW